jgi:hypothetical protein
VKPHPSSSAICQSECPPTTDAWLSWFGGKATSAQSFWNVDNSWDKLKADGYTEEWLEQEQARHSRLRDDFRRLETARKPLDEASAAFAKAMETVARSRTRSGRW